MSMLVGWSDEVCDVTQLAVNSTYILLSKDRTPHQPRSISHPSCSVVQYKYSYTSLQSHHTHQMASAAAESKDSGSSSSSGSGGGARTASWDVNLVYGEMPPKVLQHILSRALPLWHSKKRQNSSESTPSTSPTSFVDLVLKATPHVRCDPRFVCSLTPMVCAGIRQGRGCPGGSRLWCVPSSAGH